MNDSPRHNKLENEPYGAFIGLDWADDKHELRLYDAGWQKVEVSSLMHNPDAIHQFACQLQQRFPNQRVALCLEQSRGPLLFALMGYSHIDLYPVNPATSSRYRKMFHPSGAKTDPLDAEALLDLIRTHRDRLRVWKAEDDLTRELSLLVEARRKWVDRRQDLTNQLKAVLKNYYPQAIAMVSEELFAKMTLDFLRRWPNFKALKKAKASVLRAFYHAHGSRSERLICKRLSLAGEGRQLTTDKVIIQCSQRELEALIRQIRQLNQTIEKYDQQIACVFKKHPDHHLYENLPGAGKVMAPRLLAAMGTDRTRYSCAQSLQQFSGIAPAPHTSNKKGPVRYRRYCPKFIRQSFHEFAGCSINFSTWAKAYYRMQRQKHKGEQKIKRALAFKWQRILYRCWQNNEPYDEARYIQSLRKRGSPLCKVMDQIYLTPCE